MAFQAKRESGGTLQEPRIRGSVRNVAGLTTVDAESSMFESKGAPLIRVALQTRLFVVETLIDHAGPASGAPGGGIGSVRIVAVRAGHEAFIHTMLEGH